MRLHLGLFLCLSGCQVILGIDPNSTVPDAGGVNDGGASESGESGTGLCDTQNDAKNCGACGHSCQGAMCANGFCAPYVPYSGQFFQCFTLDDAYLYAQASTNILRIPKNTAMNDLYTGAEPCTDMMAMPDRKLFETTTTRVRSYTFTPNATKTYFAAQDAGGPYNLVTDQTRVFFTTDATIGEVNIAVGNSMPLYTHSEAISSLAWNGTGFLFGTKSGHVFSLADGSSTPIALGQVPTVVNSILAYGSSFIVASGTDVRVLGESTPLFDSVTGGSRLVIVDDLLYVIIGGDLGMSNGAVWRVDMRDRSKLLLAKDQDAPFRLFVDGPWVYWSTRGVVGAGRILRVAR